MSAGDRAAREVAAFDFDGTITRADTLLPFLARFRGRRRFATALAAAAAGRDRDLGKAVLLRRLLEGVPEAELRQAATDYAAALPRRFRPDTLDHLRRHQDDGHHTVIVSGSLRAYLDPVAEGLGIDGVIGVELERDGGVLTGRMVGANVRGEEKVRRLTDHLHPVGWATLWAYGNTSGDAALLDAADHPTWVGRGSRRNARP